MNSPHENQPILSAGRRLAEARAALILVHGRGATAESILELADYLPHPDMAYLAPQAAGNTWYPYSFLMPLAQNEPYLSSALAKLAALLVEVEQAGIPAERVVLAASGQLAAITQLAASSAKSLYSSGNVAGRRSSSAARQ